MYSIVILSFGILIAATLPGLSSSPSHCQYPVCSNTSLCPGKEICTPKTYKAFTLIELIVEIFFLVEYSMRMLTVWAASAQYVDWFLHSVFAYHFIFHLIPYVYVLMHLYNVYGGKYDQILLYVNSIMSLYWQQITVFILSSVYVVCVNAASLTYVRRMTSSETSCGMSGIT